MIPRRNLLIGAGAAALAACAGRAKVDRGDPLLGPLRGPLLGPLSPRPLQPSWPPFAGTIAIDGAAATDLIWLDTIPEAEREAFIAKQLAVAKTSGLTAVITTVAPSGRFWLNDAAFEKTKRDIAAQKALIAAHPGELMHILSAADLDAAHRERRLGVIFTFQGTEPLGEELDRIPMFRELGVRIIQLTHNRHNLVGDGASEPGNAGLSNYGREVVERLNAEKIVVDLAHGAQRTIREGILASKQPVLISHTGCRALSDLPRNTPDAELRALAERGGVAGMIFWPYLRKDTQPMAADLIRHLEHAINVAGEDHVGIGSDTSLAPIDRSAEFERDNRQLVADMVEQGIFERGRPADLYMFLPDLNTADRYEKLAALLAARGHSDARIAKLLGGNFARVLREVWG